MLQKYAVYSLPSAESASARGRSLWQTSQCTCLERSGFSFFAMSHLFIGTSGWNYAAWRRGFYGGRPARDWLRYAATRFSGIEINATHYRLQSTKTLRHWASETPPGFRFALKAHRYLTHNRKLSEPRGPIRTERERAAALGDRLAVVLWQLPGNFRCNLERLDAWLRALHAWRRVRHAIEFRHPSWFCDDVAARLRRRGVAAVQSDAARWPLWDAVTTDLVYVRLHGRPQTYVSNYGERALRAWARRARRWRREGRDVHVYFDNDARGAAPRNALRLIELLDHAT